MNVIKSEKIDELVKALVSFQSKLPSIKRDGVNPFHSSVYATFDNIVKVTSPILSEHGLAISQPMHTQDNGDIVLITMLLHDSGQYMGSEMKLLLSKPNMQGLGSAVTYARRYSYSSVLGLVTEVDDDGNESLKAESPKTQDAKKEPKATSETPSVPKSNPETDLAAAMQISQLNSHWAALFLTEEQKPAAMGAVGNKTAKSFGQLTVSQAEKLLEMLRAKQAKIQAAEEKATAQNAAETAQAEVKTAQVETSSAAEEGDVPYHFAKDIAWLEPFEAKVTPFLIQWKWIKPGQTYRDLSEENIAKIKKRPERICQSCGIPIPEGLKSTA